MCEDDDGYEMRWPEIVLKCAASPVTILTTGGQAVVVSATHMCFVDAVRAILVDSKAVLPKYEYIPNESSLIHKSERSSHERATRPTVMICCWTMMLNARGVIHTSILIIGGHHIQVYHRWSADCIEYSIFK